MSDIQEEIKEILEKLNNMIIFDENLIGWQIDGNGTTISKKDFKILLDYITNLQEENKKLKELCNKYEEEHSTTFIEWQKDINIIDELEKYLKKQMEYYKLDTDYYVEYKLTLDKLNELREDNK